MILNGVRRLVALAQGSAAAPAHDSPAEGAALPQRIGQFHQSTRAGGTHSGQLSFLVDTAGGSTRAIHWHLLGPPGRSGLWTSQARAASRAHDSESLCGCPMTWCGRLCCEARGALAQVAAPPFPPPAVLASLLLASAGGASVSASAGSSVAPVPLGHHVGKPCPALRRSIGKHQRGHAPKPGRYAVPGDRLDQTNSVRGTVAARTNGHWVQPTSHAKAGAGAGAAPLVLGDRLLASQDSRVRSRELLRLQASAVGGARQLPPVPWPCVSRGTISVPPGQGSRGIRLRGGASGLRYGRRALLAR